MSKIMKPLDNGTIYRELENRGFMSMAAMCELWKVSAAALRMQMGKMDRVISYTDMAGEEVYKILETDKPKFITKPYKLPQAMKDQLARCAEARGLPSLYAKLN